MKLRSVLLVLVLLLLIGGGVAGYFFYNSLGALVKAQIEEQGSAALGTRVRVGSVSISATTGEGSIRGLRVENPAGFPAGDAFSLGEITLAIDISTLTSSPIVVKSISIASPSVTATLDEQGRTNLDVIRKNAESQGGSGSSSPSSESSEGFDVLIRIDRVTSTGGSVAADLTALGGKPVTVEFSDLDLRSVGGKSGSPPAAVGSTIAVAFARAVGTAIARSGADKLIDKYLEGEAGGAAKELLKRFLK